MYPRHKTAKPGKKEKCNFLINNIMLSDFGIMFSEHTTSVAIFFSLKKAFAVIFYPKIINHLKCARIFLREWMTIYKPRRKQVGTLKNIHCSCVRTFLLLRLRVYGCVRACEHVIFCA